MSEQDQHARDEYEYRKTDATNWPNNRVVCSDETSSSTTSAAASTTTKTGKINHASKTVPAAINAATTTSQTYEGDAWILYSYAKSSSSTPAAKAEQFTESVRIVQRNVAKDAAFFQSVPKFSFYL